MKQIKFIDTKSITGPATVGIFTVGVTETASGVGIATTSYISTVLMHNAGVHTCTSSLYIYPHTEESNGGAGVSAYRLIRTDLIPSQTYTYENIWPFVLTDRQKLVVEVTGIGSVVNYHVLGGEE